MDVRCGRCGTEYEFDDALISERGTTVKCTNCGYQFKVFPDAAAAAPERWVVRTVAGRELVYTTLKDLQRGIARGHVSGDDLLSRGNRPARPLSAIPELEPFLRSNAGALPQRRAPRTLQGVAPAANASGGGDEPPSMAIPQRVPSSGAGGARPQSPTPAWDQPRDALQSDAPTMAGGVTVDQLRSALRSDAPTAPPPAHAAEAHAADSAARPADSAARAPSGPSNFRYPSSAPTVTLPGGVSLTAPTVKRTPPGGTGLLHDLKPAAAAESNRSAPPGRFDAIEPPTIPRYFAGPDLETPAQAGTAAPAAAARQPAPVVPARAGAPATRPLAIEAPPPQPGAPESAQPKPAAGAPQPPREPNARETAPSRPDSVTGHTAAAETSSTDHVARGLAEARALLQHDEQTDPLYVTSATRRNARSRWLVLVVVLGAGVLLAGTVGKRYLAKYTKGHELTASQTDATIASLLTEGERLLGRGELEGAKEAFAKASARAERDPQVVTSLATLEVVRADISWLKQRLLEGGDTAALEQSRREFARQVVGVRGAVERARLIAPEAATTARLLVHMKRLGGDVAEARRHVASLTEDASLPENAYALAVLDMAEATPVWSSVVHRLRIAAAAEGPLGLARTALAYALARSGDGNAARAELEKLTKASPSHPLIFDLRAFLERTVPAATDSEGDADASASAEPATGSSGADAVPGAGADFRAQLKQAYAAVERGQLATAERLYNAVLAKQPGNTEALSGLAEIAQRRNDTGKAARLYEEVLRKNPSYLPALMASADQKWASGDRAGAVALYRRIVQQAGADSSYGRRSAQRIAQAEQSNDDAPDRGATNEPAAPQDPSPDSASEAAPPSAQDAPSSEPAAPNESPSEPAPHIDTTDLPELNP